MSLEGLSCFGGSVAALWPASGHVGWGGQSALPPARNQDARCPAACHLSTAAWSLGPGRACVQGAVPTLRSKPCHPSLSLGEKQPLTLGVTPQTMLGKQPRRVGGASEALGCSARDAPGGAMAPRALLGTVHRNAGTFPGERARLIPPGDKQASLGPLREREGGLLLLRGTAGQALLRRAGYVGLCSSDRRVSHREEPGSRPRRSSSEQGT